MIKLGRYKHFKGKIYRVIALTKHSETLEDMVFYEDPTNELSKLWVRPASMFTEEVEVGGKKVKRFEYLGK